MKKENTRKDLSLVFDEMQRFAVGASFDERGLLRVHRFELENLAQQLLDWRKQLGLSFDLQTPIRLNEGFFTAQTRIASVLPEIVELEDKDLTNWLIDSARQGTNGEDGYKLFETDLNSSCYDFARLRSGEISLTEIPRQIVNNSLKQAVGANIFNEREVSALETLPDNIQPGFLHYLETSIRACARFHLASELENNAQLPDSMVFLAFSSSGASFALWNKEQTFCFELGEFFHLDFDESEVPVGMTPLDFSQQNYDSQVERFLNEQVYPRLFAEGFESSAIDSVVAFCTDSVMRCNGLVKSFCDEMKLAFTPQPIGFYEAVTQGLLLGSDEESCDFVPTVNLAFDLTCQAEAIDNDNQNEKAVAALANRRKTLLALVVPGVFALAVCIGLYLDIWRMSSVLNQRDTVASAERVRLKPVLDARTNYEKTLKWYEDILRQMIALRQKQGAGLSFVSSLDGFYPQNDNSFYISDINLKPGGAFEIKGLTRNEQAVTQFVRTLEFAEPKEGEPRSFQNLQLDFKKGSPFTKEASNGLAPGVTSFTARGQYAPMSVLKTATAAPPVQPVASPSPNSAPVSPTPTPNLNSNANTGK